MSGGRRIPKLVHANRSNQPATRKIRKCFGYTYESNARHGDTKKRIFGDSPWRYVTSVLEGESLSSEGDDDEEDIGKKDDDDDDDDDDDNDVQSNRPPDPNDCSRHHPAVTVASTSIITSTLEDDAVIPAPPAPFAVFSATVCTSIEGTKEDVTGNAEDDVIRSFACDAQSCDRQSVIPARRWVSSPGPDVDHVQPNQSSVERGKRRDQMYPEKSPLPPVSPTSSGLNIVKRLNFPVTHFPPETNDGPDDGEGFRFLFSEIESPDEFYVIPIGSRVDDVERLMEGLDGFYGDAASSGVSATTSLMIRLRGGGGFVDGASSSAGDFLSSARVGDVVVAKYRVDGKFYRGIVREIRGRQSLEQQQNPEFLVFYFDYGNTDWVVADDVWPLVEEFAATPPLCLRCRLVGRERPLLPRGAGGNRDGWTKADGERMSDLVAFDQWYRAFILNVSTPQLELVNSQWAERVFDVSIADRHDVFIDAALVNAGIARYGDARNALPSTDNARMPSLLADHDDDDDPIISTRLTLPFYSSPTPSPNNVRLRVSPLPSSPSTAEFVERFRTPELSGDDVCVGKDLPRRGGVELPRSSPAIGETRNDVDVGDMARDWRSSKNVYGRDVGELGDHLSLRDFSQNKMPEVCSHWKRGRCLRMDCPLLHRELTSEERESDGVLIAADCVTDGNDNSPPDLLPGEWYVVEITSVNNPSHFHFRLPVGDRPLSSFRAVEEVPGLFVADLTSNKSEDADGKTSVDDQGRRENMDVDELSPLGLKKFYRTSGHSYRLDVNLLRIGELVAVRWGPDGGIYRARVVKIHDEYEKLRVKFVDYGNTLSVSLRGGGGGGEEEEDDGSDSVMRLPPRFLHRQFRAVECHLANVVPSTPDLILDDEREKIDGEKSFKKTRWSPAARHFFVTQVQNKTLVVQVKSLMLEGEPLVDLWDTSLGLSRAGVKSDGSTSSAESSDVLLNESLIRHGYGRHPATDAVVSVASNSCSVMRGRDV